MFYLFFSTMQKINRPTRTLFVMWLILGLIWLILYALNKIQNPTIDEEEQAILEMYERVGTINSTIELNSEEWNKLQDELDEETRRIQAEQALLEEQNKILRKEKKEIQKQLVNDPQLVEDFTSVSEAETQN